MSDGDMKKITLSLLLMFAGLSTSLAQTNFYTNVTNLWYQGYKTNVLAIANERLAANSNDIAGLILKAEYHVAFTEVAEISNAYLRVIQVADTVTTTNFVANWTMERGGREDYLRILDVVAELKLTPEQLEKERKKGFIKGKTLPDGYLIEALQKDGYFDE